MGYDALVGICLRQFTLADELCNGSEGLSAAAVRSPRPSTA